MNGPEQPLVSIVTPAFNAAAYLPELLESVAAQDYPRIEHIVIDDGSSDDGATEEVLNRYPHVKWWRRENRGQYPTLNEGFRAATGDLITTISADDRYCDAAAIGALVDGLLKNPDHDVVYGFTRHVSADLTPLEVQPYQRHPVWMLRYNLGFIFHCSLLVRRPRMMQDGLLFDESLRYVGDADWMARMVVNGYRFTRVDRYIAAYRHHDTQASTMASRDALAEARRRDEHRHVTGKLQQNPWVKRMVHAYDTMQQRRVKIAGAARHGGMAEVGRLAGNWLKRRRVDGR